MSRKSGNKGARQRGPAHFPVDAAEGPARGTAGKNPKAAAGTAAKATGRSAAKPARKTTAKTMEKTAAKTATKKASKGQGDSPRAPVALPAAEAEEVQPVFEVEAEGAATEGVAEPPVPGRLRWPVRLLGWAISLLASLALALAIDALLRAAFARADWLGWLAAGIIAVAGIAALALALREVVGLLRLRRVARLRRRAEAALAKPDEAAARQLARQLARLYHGREDMRWALARLREHEAAALSPAERLRLLELEVLQPLDAEARRIILRAARDVAGLTAIVPAAALDVLIVALRNLRMLRRLAALYGGRPGWLGGWKLGRMVFSHLAVTGAIALTDAFLPHLLGKGLAGRLSARFGEGVVNGILTARIGLAALEHVRPMPFSAARQPGLKDMARALTG